MAAEQPASKWRVLFDLNVILDVLMRREPYWVDAARLWALAESGQLEGLIAAHSFTTLFYLYRRQKPLRHAYQALERLLQVFVVAGVDHQVIAIASGLAWPDFEDAVQAVAASSSGCDYLVTRNPGDYPGSGAGQLPVAILPADLLAVWAAFSDMG